MARQFYTRGMRSRSLKRSFYNKALATDELIDAYLLQAQTPGAIDALACMMRTATANTHEGLAKKLQQPVLLVWGDNDATNLPKNGYRLQGEIKNSRLFTVNQCGHYVQEEKPAELAAAIIDFRR
jgi:pimeloyl-ACP methyl ester carboxylesterase